MSRHVAFLRAINVGGHVVTMARLKSLFEELGFAGVETFIASGNVIFEPGRSKADAAERRIERHLGEALGYEVATFVRSLGEVREIAARRPFRAAALKTARSFNVGLLAHPLRPAQAKILEGFACDTDEFHALGREIYWLSQVGQIDSRFSNARFEKAAGLRATFRGMNTMQRLSAKFPVSG